MPPLSRAQRDAFWEKLGENFPRFPAAMAFEESNSSGPDMKHGTSLLTCQYSLDAKSIIAAGGGRLPGCDTSIRVFDRASGNETLVCRGHVCGIYELALQPSTGFLASASEDYSVVLWNLEQRDAIFLVGGDPIVKGHVRFASAANRIAIGESAAYEDCTNSAMVLDLDSGEEVFRQQLRNEKEVSGLAISADGNRLIVGVANHQQSPSGTDLFCWDLCARRQENGIMATLRRLGRDRVVGGKSVWRVSQPEFNVSELHWLPDEQRLVAAIIEEDESDYHSGACLLDAKSGKVVAKRVQAGIGASVAVSPDGQSIAIAYGQGGIELVQATDLAPIKTLADKQEDASYCCVQFSPDGGSALVGITLQTSKGPGGQVRTISV